jgi:hypothetical protein
MNINPTKLCKSNGTQNKFWKQMKISKNCLKLDSCHIWIFSVSDIQQRVKSIGVYGEYYTGYSHKKFFNILTSNL